MVITGLIKPDQASIESDSELLDLSLFPKYESEVDLKETKTIKEITVPLAVTKSGNQSKSESVFTWIVIFLASIDRLTPFFPLSPVSATAPDYITGAVSNCLIHGEIKGSGPILFGPVVASAA